MVLDSALSPAMKVLAALVDVDVDEMLLLDVLMIRAMDLYIYRGHWNEAN